MVINRIKNISVAALLVVILGWACDSEDVVIDGTGILSDSTVVYLPANGSANSFIITSLYEWSSEYIYPDADSGWLNYDPKDGTMPSTINVSATANDRRRRSGWLRFDNGYRSVLVNVIQYAPAEYEPGTVVLSENFGLIDVTEETDVNDYTNWSRSGAGNSNVRYSGTDATVQAVVNAETGSLIPDQLGAYPDASMGNNVCLEPGGSFVISGIGITNFNNFILTLYVAGRTGSTWQADPQTSLKIEGGTLLDELKEIKHSNPDLSENRGWYKVESEFKKIAGASAIYLRFTNTGSTNIYIDDILLESAGKGTLEIGTPVPVVTTLPAAEVSALGATLRGSYTLPEQISSVTRAGIQYRLNVDDDDNWTEVNLSTVAGEEFTYVITGTEGDIYYYRAFAEENNRVTYGTTLTVILQDGDGEEEETPED